MTSIAPRLSESELAEAWSHLNSTERLDHLRLLEPLEAEHFWKLLGIADQNELIQTMPDADRSHWLGLLDPDDITDLVQSFPTEEQGALLALVPPSLRREAEVLLAYEEDLAGGLMTSRYLAVPLGFAVYQAIDTLRRRYRQERSGDFHYIYVISPQRKLEGVMSLRELFLSQPEAKVAEVMSQNPIAIREDMHQEEVAFMFSRYGFSAIPVVNAAHQLVGLVTLDDIVEVVEEEATEDIQKLGGSEALDKPYLRNSVFDLFKKRAGWLLLLFAGSMLTTNAMGHFEHQISEVMVLSLFIPLIISSGGNAGSQASTLIVRAIALQEVQLHDWWRVLFKEFSFGLLLGSFLAVAGLCRVIFWPDRETQYGPDFGALGLTIGISLFGIVLWGTLVGSMLPFVMKKCGLDPASASAPFVATIVDVTGIIIYFTVASLTLSALVSQ
jgi:magnesium transporter